MSLRWCALPIILGALCLNGCATKHLWSESKLASFHEPAGGSLKLFDVPEKRDVLAVYDERRANGSIRRRAYLVRANQWKTAATRKPTFSDPAGAQNLQALPIFTPKEINAGAIRSAALPSCAVKLGNNKFELYTAGAKPEVYDLPVYKERLNTTRQVLLTPFALTLDVTLIGGLVFVEWASHGGGVSWK